MTNNELILTISDLMDKKFNPVYDRFSLLEANMMNGFNRLNLIIGNKIRSDIKLLAKNYLPSAIRYEKQVIEIINMQNDIDILKKVVAEHSEKLQKIS